MIISRLNGGTGNQMFQYALGRHLSLKNDTELKLDLSRLLDRTPWPGRVVFRDYELNVFHVRAGFARPSEVQKFVEPSQENRKLTYRLIRKFKSEMGIRTEPKFSDRVVKEPGFTPFKQDILSTPDNSMLIGFWQSEKYFLDVEETIRKDFAFNFELDYESKEMLRTIESTNSVCVFVRRKEFVGQPMYDTCDAGYFHRGMLRMGQEIRDPHFFIFSDDLEWCENNLRTEYPFTLVSHKYAGNQYEYYFRLMSSCEHFVIANSTYGWWAAWLSKNASKIVIAPKKWFGDESRDTRDLVPAAWMRI